MWIFLCNVIDNNQLVIYNKSKIITGGDYLKVNTQKSEDGNIITIIENNCFFTMMFSGNLDLYWIFESQSENKDKILYITKENYFVYSLFEELYNNISNCNLYNIDPSEMATVHSLEELKKLKKLKSQLNSSLRHDSRYKELFQNDKIIWISDDRDYEFIDRVEITKEEDQIKLHFLREKMRTKDQSFGTGNGPITIRFRNHGSAYTPFNGLFMNVYNKFDSYNPYDKQIHIEEYLYKVKQKKP